MRQWSNPKPDDFITCNDANLQRRRRNTSLIILTHATVKKWTATSLWLEEVGDCQLWWSLGHPRSSTAFDWGRLLGGNLSPDLDQLQSCSQIIWVTLWSPATVFHRSVSMGLKFCFHGVKILLRHVVDNKTHKKWWVAPKSTGVNRKARGPESAELAH